MNNKLTIIKRALFVVLLIVFNSVFSQEDIPRMEAEAKSAQKRIVFKANPNTATYDVTYHKLHFKLNPTISFIEGNVTTSFIAKEDMETIIFDLNNNLTVSKVIQNGVSLTFHQKQPDELFINLSKKIKKGESSSLEILYDGAPQNNGFGYFTRTKHNNSPIIWTLSEPYGAKYWWPCKESLEDKIDKIDVFITAPEKFVAVSNGLEQDVTFDNGQKTTHFRHEYPIPAYLIAIAVTNYEVFKQTVYNNGKPFDIINYVYPEDKSVAQSKTEITVDIMNIFSDLFGEYPFAKEKYGHAQFSWGGGMEHTTVSFMGNFNRGLIAHELAHQWFGNKVTCGSWRDIWLNEGFASYLEGIVIEKLDGEDSFANWRQSAIRRITSEKGGKVYLNKNDTTSINRIFSSRLSYKKGAMVLHMLRKKIGDDSFFKSLRNYLNDPKLAYSFAKTSDLIDHVESESNQQLDDFFKNWIYQEGYPTFKLEWNQYDNDLLFRIEQTQSHPSVSFFKTKLPIRVFGTNGETKDIELDYYKNNQESQESISFQIESLEIDPDYHLISKNNTTIKNPRLKSPKSINSPSSIIVYPNPVEKSLFINYPNDESGTKIVVYDFLGRKINTITSSRIEMIDFSNYESGFYFLKIFTNKKAFNKLIFKK